MHSSSRVLMIGVSVITEAMICAQLRQLGWSPVTAQDEEEALALWATDAFTCAIIDSNGFCEPHTLAQRLRQSEQARHRSPATILGFLERNEDKPTTAQSPWSDFLSRPTSQQQLKAVLPEAPRPFADQDFSELIRRLHSSASGDLTEAMSSAELDDWSAVAALMHRIKGAARMVGKHALAEAAAAAEDAALRSAPSTYELLRAVASELSQVIPQAKAN
jgi:two-component system sensor histidine kinase EvgS